MNLISPGEFLSTIFAIISLVVIIILVDTWKLVETYNNKRTHLITLISDIKTIHSEIYLNYCGFPINTNHFLLVRLVNDLKKIKADLEIFDLGELTNEHEVNSFDEKVTIFSESMVKFNLKTDEDKIAAKNNAINLRDELLRFINILSKELINLKRIS